MRSSSLKVYSPVEYTGYKEKRSGHPDNRCHTDARSRHYGKRH